MFRNLIIGQYLPGDSPVHLLDPRIKILSLVILLTGIFLVKNPLGYLVLTFFALIIILSARISGKLFWQSLKPILWLLLFTMVFHLFLTEGKEIAKLGSLIVTEEGLKRGITMSWRLILLVIFSSLLTLTTSPLALTDGLESLLGSGKKIGLPVHELAMMISLALRFIPTLLSEAEKIMKAQTARGMDFSQGSFMKRIYALLPLLVPLFIGAFRRADELATAMEARCYRGGVGRTRMKELRANFWDYLALSLVLLMVAATLGLNSYGNWSV